jgi:DNA helicase II / ATP-dependent DNA helicase PcrA
VISAAELCRLLDLGYQPTDEQAEVIECGLQPAAVIAGAGSGKTETMAARVTWLVANQLVMPEQVLGLTFTRKAAAELGTRIRHRLAQWRRVVEIERPADVEHLAVLQSQEPTVSTYAAYAGRLVGEQALRVGAEPEARLLSPALVWQISDQVVRSWRGPLSEFRAVSSLVHWVIAMAGQFADHLVTAADVERFCVLRLEHFLALPPGSRTRSELPNGTRGFVQAMQQRQALVPLVQAFQDAKRASRAVDFADQMVLAARLAQLDEVRTVERARYGAVLLDEYQDTGHAQVEMLRGLFGQGHPVTAVGDPFQSIYGWRGASARNLGAFDRCFPRADGSPACVYPLVTSFRNDRRVLAAANLVAAPLRDALGTAALRPRAGAGAGQVAVAMTETVFDEAAWVAERVASAWRALPVGARTAAVLVRRRSQLKLIADALREAELPVEIVGLGGLLTTPEVLDVVATLRVLADVKAGGALMRLLTGARWRIGPRDLATLSRRAAWLAAPDRGSLVEALDDLGRPEWYSPDGYRRLSRLAGELRQLRRRLLAPLAELVADVERVTGVGIEVEAIADRARVGRVHLDRFLDVAADFAAEAGDNSLRAFLAFLEAAENEEYGLEAGEVVVAAERIQLLTVHGAKGLEWDIVAVPGLVDGVFPSPSRSNNWTTARQELPGPLRGDHDVLPPLELDGARSRQEVGELLKEHEAAVRERHAAEERRLAYVALTRARSVLLACGYAWDTTQKPRAPSAFLTELREAVEPDGWFVPAEDAVNPCTAEPVSAPWPADPLGADQLRVQGRRATVEAGAALVRGAHAADAEPGGSARAAGWAHDVDVLLAERDRLGRRDVLDVPLPRQLSVSQLVELERNPQQLARRLRRPVPSEPAPWARRGTAFHQWLEQRWATTPALIDLDQLPGSADETATDDAQLAQLCAAFERSAWATRTPAAVEVPFEMVESGVLVRGRMDAVFGSDQTGWTVVDWKTGSRPTGAAARAAAVQLAAYRLAWARLNKIPEERLGMISAAFHYVRSNETISPADLLDAAGLTALITGRPARADRT